MKNKINILLLIDEIGCGGISKTIFLFERYLNRNFFNVFVVGVNNPSPLFPFKTLDSSGYYFLNGDLEKLKELIKDKQIDIVHIHRAGWAQPELLKAIAAAQTRCIIETNTFGYVDTSAEYHLFDTSIQISKMTHMKYLHIAKQSPNLCHSKVLQRVIYPPFDLESVQKVEWNDSIRKDLLKEYKIPENYHIIGRMGRPHESKFDDILLRMVPFLIQKTKNFRFLISGFPPEKMSLAKRLKILDYLVFTEWPLSDEKLYKLYKLLDVSVLAARMGECCSGVICEAMAAGVPVVTFSTPDRENGQIEQVDHFKTGFVANYPKAFAEAVYAILSNPELATQMGRNAKEKAMRVYAAQKSISYHEKLYITRLVDKIPEMSSELLAHSETIPDAFSIDEINQFPVEYKKRLNASYNRSCWNEKIFFLTKKISEKFSIQF